MGGEGTVRGQRRRGGAAGAAADAAVVTHEASRLAAERALRESYGRLVAILSARSGDVAGAQDALGDAFAAALATWPAQGVPDQPEAWLLTAARRRLSDEWRRGAVRAAAAASLLTLFDEHVERGEAAPFPDERLRLMFACAHPAIDAAVRAPLMLQAVLGLDAGRVAAAFVTSPATLSQRLVRAKQKIRDARIPFEIPRPEDLPARLQAVLDAVYAAYGTGWDDIDGTDHKRHGLTAEALQLGEALALLLPGEPEPLGLAALMLFCEARAPARRDGQGRYVPLREQDTTRWNAELLRAAETLLARAAGFGKMGGYQFEAAIQSAHCQARLGVPVPAEALLALYDSLVAERPSTGAWVSRACALEPVHGSAAALAALDELPDDLVATYQPYWAARAHLLTVAGRGADARAAYQRAVGLAESEAVRDWLLQQARALH
jgi:RNA polymerase sigma-70 factor (ECF subfamily)